MFGSLYMVPHTTGEITLFNAGAYMVVSDGDFMCLALILNSFTNIDLSRLVSFT